MSTVRGRRSHRFGLATALLVLGLALAFAASAAAEVRNGSATDGTEPERIMGSIDITGVTASYDTAGSLNVAITTAAPAPTTEEAVIGIRFGVLSGSECVAPLAVLVGTYERPPSAAWAAGESKGEGTVSFSGNTATLAASSSALANQPYNCVEPAIYAVEEGELGSSLEGLTAPIQLTGPPAPPVTPTPPVAPVPAPVTPPSPKPAPAAVLTIPSQNLTLHRNVWKKVKEKVTNAGTASAAKVSLKLGKAKGVAVLPRTGKVKLKSIAAGKSKTASFKVLLTAKAKPTSTLTLSVAGAKGVKTSGALTINAWKKPSHKKGKGKEEPAPPANPPLAEKIFYSYKTQVSESATLIGYAFIDGTWAYHGIPAGGLPHCTEVTGSAEKEGCLEYSFDPKTGAIRIGSLTGVINSAGELELDEEKYSPTVIPAAGTRLQVEQEYVGYRGLCGTFAGCTTWHEHLLLTSTGEFVLTRESLSTAGGTGPGETFVAAGSYPADQHGTYAIESGGRITLAFADGTSQTKTIAILLNKAGQPDPVYQGLLLDSTYFTFAHIE